MARKTPSVEATLMFLDKLSLADKESVEHVYQPRPQGGYIPATPAGVESDEEVDVSNYNK